MKKFLLLCSICSLIGLSGIATATTVVVTDLDPMGWASSGNSGGGSSAITSLHPRSGNGSIELHGDRTRFGVVLGAPVLLSSVDAFGYEWGVDTLSTSSLHPDYTPALRLHILDGGSLTELIWEGAYNGVYGSLTKGIWNTTDVFSETVWRWEGFVTVDGGGAQVNQSISDWGDSGNGWYSSSATVVAISVGVGSSVGSGYHAYADNIEFGTTAGESTTYNFETDEIPEPATMALIGTGVAAMAARRKRLV